MKTVIDYLKNSYYEMKLVTWPKQRQVTTDTVMVIIISLIFAMVLGAIDFGLKELFLTYLNLDI